MRKKVFAFFLAHGDFYFVRTVFFCRRNDLVYQIITLIFGINKGNMLTDGLCRALSK